MQYFISIREDVLSFYGRKSMAIEIKDYVPFMDKYPELKLKPVTAFQNHCVISEFDYVQDLNLSGPNALHGCFYLIVKSGRFGLYMYDSGILFEKASVVLKPVYETIDFLWFRGRSVGVIVKYNGKYGLCFWSYGYLEDEKLLIAPEFDQIEIIVDNSRLRAIKNGVVTYYDFSGHVLK